MFGFQPKPSFKRPEQTTVANCALILLIPVSVIFVANAQQPADSGASSQNVTDSLKAIDRLIEQNQRLEKQNQQLEKQNQQLMEQINVLRRGVTQDTNVSSQAAGAAALTTAATTGQQTGQPSGQEQTTQSSTQKQTAQSSSQDQGEADDKTQLPQASEGN